jgi:prophage antirepressor-like protein
MNLEIFKNSGFELRGGLINGEPFFVLADICKALNLTNPTEVAKTLNESTLSIIEVAINNRQVKVNAVSEIRHFT